MQINLNPILSDFREEALPDHAVELRDYARSIRGGEEEGEGEGEGVGDIFAYFGVYPGRTSTNSGCSTPTCLARPALLRVYSDIFIFSLPPIHLSLSLSLTM